MRAEITGHRLTSLFRPQRVALVGASDRSPFSRNAYENLVSFGFGARTYLVNRRGVLTHGQPTVRSCAEIGDPVDVAFLMVPQAGMLEALDDAAAAGIRNAVVLSAGYAEAGAAGRAAQAELVAHAESLGIVLLGPNHLGFANFVDGAPVCSIPGLPRQAGPVALLSHSGASCSAMVQCATMANVALSYLVTLGNEAMITAGHVLDFLVDDPATRAVAIFMEAVRDPEVFRRAARRAADAGKAIVVLKVGSSELSARTAAAHTGALVGDDRVISAVFTDLGVIRVDSIEDMLITAGAAAALGRLERAGIGIVSNSGGACDIIADQADDLGVDLPELGGPTRDALTEVLPSYATVQNPLDTTGAAVIDPSIFTRSIEVMSRDPAIGVVGVVHPLPWADDGKPYFGQKFVDAIGAGMQAAACPAIYISMIMHPVTDHTQAVLRHGQVPYVIPGLRHAIVALRNVGWWSRAARLQRATGQPATGAPDGGLALPAPGQRNGQWSEDAARRMLERAGVPVIPARLVSSADEAVKAATAFGEPVSVKVASPQIAHKTDLGGVRLDVPADSGAVRDAFRAVTAAAERVDGAVVEGVLVSPMRRGGTELLVGVVRDPDWGPVLAVALGGVFVEVLQDSALAPLPVTARQARILLGRLRGAAVLRGGSSARGAAPADLDALCAVIARIGDLALALGNDLESLEVNPLRVAGPDIEALDAAVTWSAAPTGEAGSQGPGDSRSPGDRRGLPCQAEAPRRM
jgi:acetate---CoA ligase (ADP-forming)